MGKITILSLILLLKYVQLSSSISVPTKGWVSEEHGILLEPDTLIIHYDQVVYTTIGVKFGLLPSLEENRVKIGHTCALGPERLGVLQKLNSSIGSFFQTIPKSFSEFADHFCEDGTVDCYFDVIGQQRNSSYSHLMKRPKKKRQVYAAILAVAGLTAIGSGLYHLFSGPDLQSHLNSLDRRMEESALWMKQLNDQSEKYHEISEDTYGKLYHGTLNNEKLLADGICKIESDNIYSSAYLQYSLLFESYKRNFLEAMDGEVSDFLVDYDLLEKRILKRPEFRKTIYGVDPGLFYAASTSMLTRLSQDEQIAYFTITTPLLKEMDVSPLYKIYNLGWWAEDKNIKADTPEHAYFLTDKTNVELVAPNLGKCQHRKGLYLCHLRDSQLSSQANCLTQMILNNKTKGCPISVKQTKPHCRYETTKGGVLILGCSDIAKVSSFRGIPRKEEVSINETRSKFFPYRSFDQLSINNNIVSSKNVYLKYIKPNSLPALTYDLSEIEHLIIPGVEQNIEEMRNLRDKSMKTAEGFIKDLVDRHQKDLSLFWYFIGIAGVVNFLIVVYQIWKMLPSCRREKRSRLEEIMEMRRGLQ